MSRKIPVKTVTTLLTQGAVFVKVVVTVFQGSTSRSQLAGSF